MDNEQLKKYIEENREAMDIHQPAPQLWDNIEEELHPEKKRRGIIWWGGIAAGIALIFGIIFMFPKGENAGVSENKPNQVNKESTTPIRDRIDLRLDSLQKKVDSSNTKSSFDKLEKEPKTIDQSSNLELNNIELEVEYKDGETIIVKDNETGDIAGIYKPNDKTGKYLFILPPGRSYNVTLNPNGYLLHSENLIVPSNNIDSYRSYQEVILNYEKSNEEFEALQKLGGDNNQFKNIEVNEILSEEKLELSIIASQAPVKKRRKLIRRGRNKLPKPVSKVDKLTYGLGIDDLIDATPPPPPSKKEPKIEIVPDEAEGEDIINIENNINVNESREKYDEFKENDFLSPLDHPQSTFSIDVDAAGYSNVRRFINNDQLPPKDAVKLEEMVNYFNYDYKEPSDRHPFSFTTEIGECPWNTKHKLVHIGLQGKSIEKKDVPASNLVFLIDVSGSMQSLDKLELLKKGFRLLTKELRSEDKVSIVVYAGAAGLVLPPTNGNNQEKIINAIDRLSAGGSTAGGEGIELAYKVAMENFKKKGNNRVILATDGDFNVGISQDKELTKMIEEKRKTGVFLTVLGFGSGNFQASKMEKLADNGNGNFAYIDNTMEAKKVMVNEFGALYTIAKDVKLQIEFNPSKVKGYRLIGYENRIMAAQDFNNDAKDAGELGAGHSVTALYEIIPADSEEEIKKSDTTRYFTTKPTVNSKEFMQIKFRYKPPKEDESILITHVVKERETRMSENFFWSAAVAELGLVLRDSKHKGNASFKGAYESGKKGINNDDNGYRHEFMSLIKKAESLKK